MAVTTRVHARVVSQRGCSLGKVDVAVCTLERANSFINSLLFPSDVVDPRDAAPLGIEAVRCIVVDELHLIGDGKR